MFHDEFERRINNALSDLNAVVLSYVDTRGQPHSSFYGSLHVHDAQTLGLWVRKRSGELMKRIGDEPFVSVTYADLSTRTYYQLKGRACLVQDPAGAEAIYNNINPFEQSQDPDRLGCAVIINVEQFAGRDEERNKFGTYG